MLQYKYILQTYDIWSVNYKVWQDRWLYCHFCSSEIRSTRPTMNFIQFSRTWFKISLSRSLGRFIYCLDKRLLGPLDQLLDTLMNRWGHNGLLPDTSVLVDWNRTFILVIWFMVCWRLKFYSINIILHRLWNNTYQIIFFRLHADIFTFLKFHWAIATLITKFF